MSVYTTPAIDLLYSLYCNITFENRQKHREDYIKYYHDEFVKALKSYGYTKEPPSLLDLNIELLKCSPLEVLIVICFTSFLLNDWSSVDQENFSFSNMDKEKIFALPECQKIIKAELKRLFYMGAF